MKVNFFEEILPQVTTAVEFHHKKKKQSAMIKAKDILNKLTQVAIFQWKKIEIQTIIASFMSLGYVI